MLRGATRRAASRRFCSLWKASAFALAVLSSVLRVSGSFLFSRGFAGLSLALSSWGRWGSSACSLKDSFDPTGRFKTVPGLAIVAATIAGSCVSLQSLSENIRLGTPSFRSRISWMVPRWRDRRSRQRSDRSLISSQCHAFVDVDGVDRIVAFGLSTPGGACSQLSTGDTESQARVLGGI